MSLFSKDLLFEKDIYRAYGPRDVSGEEPTFSVINSYIFKNIVLLTHPV